MKKILDSVGIKSGYDIFCTIIGFIVIVCLIGFLGGNKNKQQILDVTKNVSMLED